MAIPKLKNTFNNRREKKKFDFYNDWCGIREPYNVSLRHITFDLSEYIHWHELAHILNGTQKKPTLPLRQMESGTSGQNGTSVDIYKV